MTDSLELDLENDIFGDEDLGSSDVLQSMQTTNTQPSSTVSGVSANSSTSSAVGEKRKRDADTTDATSAPLQDGTKRTPTSASRLNQAQSNIAAPPLPVASGGTAADPKKPSINRKNLGFPEDLNSLKVVLASNGRSTFSDVSILIVNLESKNRKKLQGAIDLLKQYRKRMALLDGKEADEKIGLSEPFSIAYMQVSGAFLNLFGNMSDMAKPKKGEPDFTARTHVLWLRPSLDEAKDRTETRIQTREGYVRMPPVYDISTQTVAEAKNIVTHLFGEIFDGLPYGTETLRRICLVQVLKQVQQERPGSELLNETKATKAIGSLDDVDDEPLLKLASGELIGLKHEDVYDRVKRLFISKGIAPIKMHTDDKELRKTVPWHDPRADTLVLSRKVARKMDANELAQAAQIQPRQSRAVLGSWPVNKPIPTDADFMNPEKANECESYVNSCGYVLNKFFYKTLDGSPYILPRIVEDDDSDERPSGAIDISSLPVIDDNHQSTSSAIIDNNPTQGNAEFVTFVGKRAPRTPRVVSIGSLVGATLRVRPWATMPGQNPDGAYGVHFDLASSNITMIERRVSKLKSRDGDIVSRYGVQISEEEYIKSLPTADANDYLPM